MSRSILAVLPFLAVAVSSCCSDPVDQSSYFCMGDLSIEDEQKMGDSYAPVIDVQYDGEYNDPQAADYLGGLVREMASNSVYGNSAFSWKFEILNTSIPNAFAVPGGYVYITRGLLANLDTEGQFISVLGHELGHVEHRHIHQQMGRSMIGELFVGALDTAESIATNGSGPGIAGQIGGIATQLTLLRFSRGQESQADMRGVFYAAKMGYDPADGEKTFAYFQKLEAESGGDTPEILRTHPLNEDRIANIQKEIETHYPETLNRPASSFRPNKDGNSRFAEVVARIKQVEPIYEKHDKALDLVMTGMDKKDKAKVQQGYATLQTCANQLSDDEMVQTSLGIAQYAMDDLNNARSSFQHAITLDDRHNPSRKLYRPRFLLGLVEFDAKQYAKAKSALSDAIGVMDQDPQAYYVLGETNEALGDRSSAKSAYESAAQLGEGTDLGKKAAEKAAKL